MNDYWEENGLVKPDAYIVCAACKYGDLILCSARHWDKTMNTQFRELRKLGYKISSALFKQGFINQFGEFLTREDAMITVKKTGQKIDMEQNGRPESKLFSEGLY